MSLGIRPRDIRPWAAYPIWMEIRLLVFALLFATASSIPVWAGFLSPFPSTVEGVDIPNAHEIGPKVIRGMAPRKSKDIEDLIRVGVEDILVFKNQTGKEVDKELRMLEELGFPEERVYHIPFRWKDMESFRTSCVQTIEGLRIMRDASRGGRGVFFHCTSGEDRTGYLAALYRMLAEGGDAQELFRGEMCENGYGRGNPNKPWGAVVSPLRKELTPLYLKMAHLIWRGALTMDSLDASVCGAEPRMRDVAAVYDAKTFRCQPSSKFRRRSRQSSQ